MRLWEIQDYIATLLAADLLFAAAGLVIYDPETPASGTGIIVDDGMPSKIDGREAALADLGLCLTVLGVRFHSVLDSTRSGHAATLASVDVVIEENLAVNLSDDGTGIPPLKALDMVLSAVLGKPEGGGNRGITLEGWDYAGVTNGVRQYAAQFLIPQTFP